LPATQLTLSSAITWALQAAAGAFSTNRIPNTQQGYNATPSLTLWNQVFAAVYTIFLGPPGSLSSALAGGGSLTSGHTYYYKVTGTGPTGQNGTGVAESAASNETSQTVGGVGGTSLAVTLTWNALQGSTSYNVYRGASAGAENLLVGTVAAVAGAATYSFTDTGFAGASQSPPVSGPANFAEFDIRSFVNAIGEVVNAGHVWALYVVPTGGAAQCLLAPGSTNGLTNWFLGGTNPTYLVPVNGQLLHCEDPAGPGAVLDSGHRTLRLTNGGPGSNTLTAVVVAVVGP
jgi:hypothetical protein